MSKFEVLILPIDKVEKHPQADRLSLNHVRGYVAVSNKNADGTHRYSAGQLVAYVPINAIVPVSLLKARGYWDEKKDKGFLGGDRGNIVRPINLRGVVSQGLIFPTEYAQEPDLDGLLHLTLGRDEFTRVPMLANGHGHKRMVNEGDNVTGFLGITKHVVPYPVSGRQVGIPVEKIHYELEDLKKFPKLLEGHQVIITELLHGILCIVGYDRRYVNPFFVSNGSMTACHLDPEDDNIYTQTAKPIWEDIKRYLVQMPGVERFYIFGEIIGPGIQDITYGLESTEFRALDVQMGMMGAGRDSIPFGFIGVRKYELLKWLNISTAPILWAGKYDRDVVNQLTDGPAAIGGSLRKGVVITSEDENFVDGKRPILKNISDDYYLRTKATEYK